MRSSHPCEWHGHSLQAASPAVALGGPRPNNVRGCGDGGMARVAHPSSAVVPKTSSSDRLLARDLPESTSGRRGRLRACGIAAASEAFCANTQRAHRPSIAALYLFSLVIAWYVEEEAFVFVVAFTGRGLEKIQKSEGKPKMITVFACEKPIFYPNFWADSVRSPLPVNAKRALEQMKRVGPVAAVRLTRPAARRAACAASAPPAPAHSGAVPTPASRCQH